jgi:hypothetical protein
MAAISRSPNTDRAIYAATVVTRTAVAVGVPLYLYLKLDSVPTLHSPPGKLIAASVAILTAPSTLYCALGALEGVVRSCIQYFNYQAYSKPEYHWDQFCKEAKTTNGLVQASVSPLAGYTFMYREWNKKPRIFKDSRVLKEEYVTYSALRSTAHFLVDAGTWTLRKLKIGIDRSIAQITSTIQTAWRGVCWVVDTTVSIVQWAWRISQPFRELVWNIGVAVKDWSVDRIVELWNFSKPVWKLLWNKFVVQLVWNSLIHALLWNFAIKTIIWEMALKTVVWDFVIKTVLVDWIVTKLVINLICEIIIVKVLWPPVKFLWQKIVWPVLNWTVSTIGTIKRIAFDAIAWALQQAFRRGR